MPDGLLNVDERPTAVAPTELDTGRSCHVSVDRTGRMLDGLDGDGRWVWGKAATGYGIQAAQGNETWSKC